LGAGQPSRRALQQDANMLQAQGRQQQQQQQQQQRLAVVWWMLLRCNLAVMGCELTYKSVRALVLLLWCMDC
jgi:hypothetical protein